MPQAKSNSLFSNSFFIFIIRFFPSLANLLVVILYSRKLPEAVYGNYQHFWIQLNVIYPLACFGIHVLAVTYSRGFIMKLLRDLTMRQYALYALWVLVLSGLFAFLQSSALSLTFVVPFLFIIAYSFTFILESFLIVCRNYKGMTVINVLYATAFALIHYYALRQALSLQELFTYLLVITAIRLLIYCGMAAWNMKQPGHDTYNELHTAGEVRKFWLHIGFYDASQLLFSWIDKFIISLLLSAQLSAIYFNGTMNIPFLPLLLSAAGSAVLMQLARGNRQDETADTIQLMNQLGRTLSCIVFPLFFFLLFFRHELIVTLLTEKYIPAIPVFMMSIMVLPLRAYSFTTVLQRMHKGAIINTGAVADLTLACLLMYPLYKWLGLPGAALSFVISTYLQSCFYLIYSARLLSTSPLKLLPLGNWIRKLIVFALLFIVIRYAGDRYFSPMFTLILGGALMVITIAASLLTEFSIQKKHGGS